MCVNLCLCMESSAMELKSKLIGQTHLSGVIISISRNKFEFQVQEADKNRVFILEVLAYNSLLKQLAILFDGQFFIAMVSRSTEHKNISVSFIFQTKKIELSITEPKSFQGAFLDRSLEVSSIGRILNSPLTGRVVKIFVHPGDFVQKGQKLVSIESMKMENILYADNDLRIKTILINHSDVVQSNQELMVFEVERGYDESSTEQFFSEEKT